MPWFKIDDSAHSHPKWMRAGNAAIGLWARCGSYSAQHLTEGVIAGEIARLYGTEAQISKLIKAGLWHAPGHNCGRCPQPEADDYVMHDFFEGGRNTTKAQAEASREAAADRQRKHRAKRNGEETAPENSGNATHFERKNAPKTPQNDPLFSEGTAGQEDLSQRDAIGGVTPPHAFSLASTSVGSTESRREPDAREPIPEWALPLVHRMHASGLSGIRWNFGSAEWLIIDACIKAKGIEAMADSAVRAAGSSSRPVVTARYFMNGWKEIPNKPPDGTAKPDLRLAAGGPLGRLPMSTTDQRVAQAQALKSRPPADVPDTIQGEIAR